MAKFSLGGVLCGTAKFRTPTTIIIIFKLVTKPNVVEFVILDHQWQEWRSHAWQDQDRWNQRQRSGNSNRGTFAIRFNTETSLSLWSCRLFFWFRAQPVATGVNATGGVQRTPHHTHAYAHFSRAHFTRDDCTCGSRLSVLRVSQIHSFLIMSLLDVPFRPFPPIFSSPTCSLTRPSASSKPLTGIRRPPCATPIPDTKKGCEILRTVEQKDRAVMQSLNSLLGWLPF